MSADSAELGGLFMGVGGAISAIGVVTFLVSKPTVRNGEESYSIGDGIGYFITGIGVPLVLTGAIFYTVAAVSRSSVAATRFLPAVAAVSASPCAMSVTRR